MRRLPACPAIFVAAAMLTACGSSSEMPISATYGPNPTLTAPDTGFPPSIGVPKAVGWPSGAAPTAAPGFTVRRFASGLDHPRRPYVLPNGDVLVAESSTRPGKPKGLMGLIKQQIQKRAGALNDSADRISLLRDRDGDGVAESRTNFLTNLNQPFGMALIGDKFYVANTDAIWRYDYRKDDVRLVSRPVKIADLPHSEGGHWTRDLAVSPDGKTLYVSVGSATNIADDGMAKEAGRAAIHEIDLATGARRVFATGLRNPNGLTFEPATGVLWTVVNERDMIGNDLVPDYMTSVREGGFYGWPYSYFGQHVDARVKPQRPDLVARAIKPDYALGAHTASLGLAFHQGGAFVAQHGSWNRRPVSGYRVIFVPFAGGKPSGPPRDVLTGFLAADRKTVYGRPVGLAVDAAGGLLVADDNGDAIWRVTGTAGPTTP